MAEEAEPIVLRRKASARQSAVGPTVMDIPKAMRFAMAKAGDAVLQTPVGVREVVEDTLIPDGLTEGVPEHPLVLALRDENGSAGVAICCLQTVSAVVEASTIGTVLPVEASERTPTRTDAALTSVFLDQFLAGFAVFAQGCDAPPLVEGFSCDGALEDVRAGQMLLPDVSHRRFKITVDFALGSKVGTIVLVYPRERRETQTAIQRAEDWSENLEKAVLPTSASMDAILCQIKVPLSQISSLKAGDVLPLPGARLDGVSLIGIGGKRISRAKLGRSGNARALRVIFPSAEEEAEANAAPGGDFAAEAPAALGVMSLPPAAPPPLGDAAPDLGGLGGDLGGGLAAEPPALGGIDLDLSPVAEADAPALGAIDLDVPGDAPGGDAPGLGAIDLDAAIGGGEGDGELPVLPDVTPIALDI